MTLDTGSATAAGNDEVTSVISFIHDWALIGWRQDAGGEPFNFRTRLGKYYDWTSADVVLFDNADPQRRLNRSAAEYAAIWDDAIPKLNSLSNTLLAEPIVNVYGDIAIAEVTFRSRFEAVDGTVDEAPTFSSLVLRKSEEGWKIVREHGTSMAH